MVGNVLLKWIQEPEIKDFINKRRSKSAIIKKSLDQKKVIDRKDKEINLLNRRIEAMKNEIKNIKLQIEVADGELYKKKHVKPETGD